MKSSAILAVALTGLAAAAPIKRAMRPTDVQILNYALTLEHLENNFYREGLKNFTQADFEAAGFDAEHYQRIQSIANDEATHVKFLTDALTASNASAVAECTYAFGVTDVQSFLATASVLEGVGVSAYLGAAADIVAKTTLTAAGSILSVEARHSSYIRQAIRQNPFPAPFDTPLSYNQVFTLAAQFIKTCPATNVALPLKAFPALAASSTETPLKEGSTVTLKVQGKTACSAPSGTKIYAAFITITGPIFVEATPVSGGFTVSVPKVSGQSYVVLTKGNEAANDDTIIAGPAIVEV